MSVQELVEAVTSAPSIETWMEEGGLIHDPRKGASVVVPKSMDGQRVEEDTLFGFYGGGMPIK